MQVDVIYISHCNWNIEHRIRYENIGGTIIRHCGNLQTYIKSFFTASYLLTPNKAPRQDMR